MIDDDHLAAPSVPGRPAPEGVDELGDQRALARPGDAGDARQHALRYPDAEVAQVVGRRVLDAERVVERPAVATARRGDPVVQGARCRGVGVQQVVETSGEDHLAAAVAGAGADVDDPVRRADDRRVVLDDEHGVAVVAQAAEHGDEVIDVPWMEPHGRLVQDVDEIDEVAVELPGHLYPLALAAGQRRHAAVERQVADADVDQVPERPAHPGDQRRDDVADRLVVVAHEELIEHAVQLRQLALDEPSNGPAARELHRARRGIEPNAAAIGARPLGEQPPIRLLAGARGPVLVLVDVQPLELAGDAFEGPLVRRALVGLLDAHVVRPQQALPLSRREAAQRLAGRDDPGLDDLAPVPLPDIVGGMADGALLDALVEVKQLVDVDRDALAEALAGGAHAVGMVEREAVRPAGERPAAAREEHPQVGVDLGDRADGAAAASSQALLVDHDAGEMFRIASTGGRVSWGSRRRA